MGGEDIIFFEKGKNLGFGITMICFHTAATAALTVPWCWCCFVSGCLLCHGAELAKIIVANNCYDTPNPVIALLYDILS